MFIYVQEQQRYVKCNSGTSKVLSIDYKYGKYQCEAVSVKV